MCSQKANTLTRHDAFARLLSRFEPDAETLWQEVRTHIDETFGIVILDGSTIDKPFSTRNAFASKPWFGKHQSVVYGINLITLLWGLIISCFVCGHS